jgi:hypothetical protein
MFRIYFEVRGEEKMEISSNIKMTEKFLRGLYGEDVKITKVTQIVRG